MKISQKVGRPKIIDRNAIIKIALNKYWINGIDKVKISDIAKESGVSRPGIYKEFKDVANLKALTLKEYEKLVAVHYYSSFNTTNDLLNLIETTTKEQLAGKNRMQPYCYFYTTKSLKCTLDDITKKELNRINNKLEKSICVAVAKARKNKQINNILNIKDTAKAINSHFMNMIVMHRAGIPNKEIMNFTKLFIRSLQY